MPPKAKEKTGRRRTIAWIVALLAVALLGPACWWGYSTSKVMQYARLAELKLSRDWLDPETVGVSYVPLSSGTVLLRRRAKDRTTAEMPLRIGPADVGSERRIRWPLDGLKAGEVIEVVSRDGSSLVTAQKTVPEAIVPPGMKAAAGGGGDDGGSVGLYSRRTKAGRAQWLGKYGGTPESEKAVAAGLDWLARHQAADGSWSNRCLGPGPESRCEKDCALHGRRRDVRNGPHRAGGAGLPGRRILRLQRHGLFRRGPQGPRLDREPSRGRRRAGGIAADQRSRRLP